MLYRLPIIGILLLPIGCRQADKPPTPAGESAVKQVTLIELEKETDHLVFLSYVGSDEQSHYFLTPERKRYKVDRSEWQLPPHMVAVTPRPGSMAVFVKIKGGKVTAPDPKKMAELKPEQLMQGQP